MWCFSPTAGTGQATQAGASAAAARVRKVFSSPPAAGLVSSLALTKRAGCADARAAGARSAPARRTKGINERRAMARSVLVRAVRADRDRPVDRREANDRRGRVAELDPAGVVVPVLPRLRAGPRAALEGGAPGALDPHSRTVAVRDRQREGAGAGLRLQPPLPARAGQADGE